jgi:hypothetical protein
VDIVNECSETYQTQRPIADVVVGGITAAKGLKDLPKNYHTLKEFGTKTFLKSAENAHGLGSGAVSSANKIADWTEK